ncbi:MULTISPECIES: hypothetical protein [Acidovorax]|uniref:hypothetical protein n=1 Tax=Acidovorax TaxID=12916 RepID=UPI0002376264|nr:MULTISPECIES: hypothetical protein [Acidovorax]KRD25479.1 hypothetical protein ASE39_21345 [Acidovorax sp. Root267]
MLDISQATNMLTSLGVSSTMAAKAAERTAQNHAGADPVTFLKELQTTLEQLSAEAAQGTAAGTTGATTTAAQTKPYQSTAALYSSKAATETGTTQAAVKAPFSNLEEFREWESDLGDTFAEDYEVPDYVRMISMSLSGGDQEVVGRYMFFKNHPEFAADYEAIRSGKLSKFPTDGSTLVKSDLTEMPSETASFYKKNTARLLAAEGFNMDPTLAKMRTDGVVEVPDGVNPSEWLMNNRWTPDEIVAQNNRVVFARAPYIGLDGKGADTYRLTTYDSATNSIINFDGIAYDPVTGEAKA